MILPVNLLQEFVEKLIFAFGTPQEASSRVADSLVTADMCGRVSHGVAILPLYAQMIAARVIDPLATPRAEHLTDSMIRVDGRCSFGQLTGQSAVASGIKAIGNNGVVVIGIRNGTHLGRLGEWAEQATASGLVFMAFVNTSGGAKNVAAFGGARRKLSTNPVAFGIPAFNVLPFNIIADFATSQVSGSVIREHYRADIALHPEWTTTESGAPLRNAQAFMDGAGALLPLGGRVAGHKGFGLAVIVELLSGLVGGMVVGQQDPEWFSNNAMFVLIDPCKFLEVEEIESRIAAVAKHLHENEQVRLPGEGSFRKSVEAKKSGIEIQDYVVHDLVKLAADLAVEIPDLLSGLAHDTTKEKFKSW